MNNIRINGVEHSYSDAQVITFAEGLVGMPALRRAVLIPLTDFEPFSWLASLDDERGRFVVVDPRRIYGDYDPATTEETVETLAIVTISSNWQQTTVNLRAPIVVDRSTRQGVQQILNDSSYSLAEAMPQ
jgi:flagellar assembly factor FliW